MPEPIPTASQVMDPNPSVLRETDRIADGARIIMDHRYRNLPVVDAEGRYLGIFGVSFLLRLVLPKAVLVEQGLQTVPYVRDTLKDLRQRLAEVEEQQVSCCLEDDVPVVSPATPLVETLLILYRSRCSLPVVEPESGRLVGMISYFDVGERILAQEL